MGRLGTFKNRPIASASKLIDPHLDLYFAPVKGGEATPVELVNLILCNGGTTTKKRELGNGSFITKLAEILSWNLSI